MQVRADGPALSPAQQRARDIFQERIEINTVTAPGDTERAAKAMSARLRTAGFEGGDVQVFTPAPHEANLVARLRGTGARRPSCSLRISTSWRRSETTGRRTRSS